MKRCVLNRRMGDFGKLGFKSACDLFSVTFDGLSGQKVQIDTSGKRQGGHLPKIKHWASNHQYVDTSGGVKCNFPKC
jgi:hypothetical protein